MGANGKSGIKKKGYPPLARTFDTKATAQAWGKQIESEMDRGVFVSRTEAEGTTLAEALDRYGREYTEQKKSRVKEHSRLRVIARDPLSNRSLSSIDSHALAEYRDKRLKRVGPKTVHHELTLLSHILSICQKEWGIHLPRGNPADNVKKPKLPPGRTRRLVDDEAARLLDAAKVYGGEIGRVIPWAIETAMRRGEIVAMRWEHVDRKARVLLIPETKLQCAP